MNDETKYRINSTVATLLYTASFASDVSRFLLNLTGIGLIINRIISPFSALFFFTCFKLLGINFLEQKASKGKDGKEGNSQQGKKFSGALWNMLLTFLLTLLPGFDFTLGLFATTVSTWRIIVNSRKEDEGIKSPKSKKALSGNGKKGSLASIVGRPAQMKSLSSVAGTASALPRSPIKSFNTPKMGGVGNSLNDALNQKGGKGEINAVNASQATSNERGNRVGAEITGKAVEKVGSGLEMAGKATKTAGTVAQAGGKAVKYTGETVKYTGKAIDTAGSMAEKGGKGIGAAGKGIATGGSKLMQAGAEMSSTGWGAVAGVPLALIGGTAAVAGKATELGGKVVEGAGKATKFAGKATEKVGQAGSFVGNKIDKAGSSTRKAGKGMQKWGEFGQDIGKEIAKGNDESEFSDFEMPLMSSLDEDRSLSEGQEFSMGDPYREKAD